MGYKIELPPEMLKRLFLLREYCGEGPIIGQVRESVALFLKRKETELGTTIEDAAETIEKYREKESQLNS